MTAPWVASIDSLDEWPETSYRLRVTDGLPTFPPTRARVDAMVAASGWEPDDVIGAIPPADLP